MKTMKKKTKKMSPKLLTFLRELEERINRGAKYLDKFKPDWYLDTKLDELDLESPTTCMLGQAFSDFWNKIIPGNDWGSSGKAERGEDGSITMIQAQRRGFALEQKMMDEFPGAYDILTALWVERISRMRLQEKYQIDVCKIK